MSGNLAYAQQRSKELTEAIHSKEGEILALLQAGGKIDVVTLLEHELAALVAEADDAATVMAYYQRLGEMERGGDVFKLVFQIDRAAGHEGDRGSTNTTTPPPSVPAFTTAAVPTRSDAALSASAVDWSTRCLDEGTSISGLIIATRTVLFVVLEGSNEEAVMAMGKEVIANPHSTVVGHVGTAIIVPSTFMLLQTMRASSRMHPMGLKLHYVEDAVMDIVLAKCREVVALGARFAPKYSAAVAIKGGNPAAEVITTSKGVPVMLITMAYRVGLVYSPAAYDQLAAMVEALVAPFEGKVVERFGEHMVVAFDRKGKWPSTCLMEVAQQLLGYNSTNTAIGATGASMGSTAGVPAVRKPPTTTNATAMMGTTINHHHDLHVVLHMGDVTFVNNNHCIAYGEGIREVKRLALVAEAAMRPLLITPIVLLHCSKAQYRTINFSHNTVMYSTFAELELTRSVQLPEPFKLEAPSGMKVVPRATITGGGGTATQRGSTTSALRHSADDSHMVDIVPATREELQQGMAAGMPREGNDSQVEEFKTYFRRLDGKGNGWITKTDLRRFLLSNEAFVIFPHDAPRIDDWIAESTTLGRERMNLDEFLYLCVRLRQL